MLLLAQDTFTEIGGMTATSFTVTETNHNIKNVGSVLVFKKQNRSTQVISLTLPIFLLAFNHIKRIMIVLMQWDFGFFRFRIMYNNLGTAAIISMVWCVNARKVKQTMIDSTMPLLHQFFLRSFHPCSR